MSIESRFKTRNPSIDLLRAISVLFVILSHTLYMMRDLGHTLGIWSYGTYTIGPVGVSFFVIISGYLAGLKLSKTSASEFLYSKLTGILPIYWACYLFVVVLSYLLTKLGFHADTNFNKLIASNNVDYLGLMLSIFGLDKFIEGSNLGLQVYPVVGEWYIGFIIIMFSVAPLLYYAVKVFGAYFFALIIFLTFLFYEAYTSAGMNIFLINISEVYWNPQLRFIEFVFGLALPSMLTASKDALRSAFLAALTVIGCYVWIYISTGFNYMVAMSPYASAFGCAVSFVTIYMLQFVRFDRVGKFLRFFSKYSFIVMLLQGVIIRFTAINFQFDVSTSQKVLIMFIANVIISYLIAFILYPWATRLSLFMRKAFNFLKADKVSFSKV